MAFVDLAKIGFLDCCPPLVRGNSIRRALALDAGSPSTVKAAKHSPTGKNMPTITNHFGIPDQFLNYARKKLYSRGKSNSSITTLIDSPQVAVLKEARADDMVIDISDMIWSLLGTAVHNVLHAQETEGVAEKRLFLEINGWVISGQPDISYSENTVIINDHKMSTSWNYMEPKDAWEAQLNGYDWLYRHVQRNSEMYDAQLQVTIIIRDWSKGRVGRFKNYPAAPIQVIPITRWRPEKQDDFFEKRVKLHQEALGQWMKTGTLPECTPEDMWHRPGSFKIMGGSGKRPVRIVETKEEAEKLKKPNQWIEKQVGSYIRCRDYCEVSAFCKQNPYRDQQEKTDDGHQGKRSPEEPPEGP